MTDQEHVMHRMVNGRCPACVAASGGEAHIVLAEGGGYVIGGGGGGGSSPEVTEDRRLYVELAEGGASKGGASYAGGGVRADGGGASSGTGTGGGGRVGAGRGGVTVAAFTGDGGGHVGDPVDITVTDEKWSNKLSGSAACHITSKITPGTNGQVTIHLECQEDTSKWIMVHFTADEWDIFKAAGDLMLDRAIRMTDR